MSSTFDFTQLGGFPLVQDTLESMQETYVDMAKALVNTTEPVILDGLIASTVSTTVNYTEGYVAYNGEVIKVAAGSHHISAINSAQIKIIVLTTTLVYDNGSTHAAKVTKTAEIVQDGTGTFLINGLRSLMEFRAAQLRGDWIQNKNDDSGLVEYQIDKLNRRCNVRGWTRHFDSYNSSGQPVAQAINTTMPSAAYRTFFDASIDAHNTNVILTSTGSELRGGKGRIVGSSLGFFPIALQGTWTEAQLKTIKHYFNFSYPI